MLDSGSRVYVFEPHWRNSLLSLSKTFYPQLNTGSTEEGLKLVDWDV